MKAYLHYEDLLTDHIITAGTDTLEFAGELSQTWIADQVKLVSGTTANDVSIDSVTYDTATETTSIVFVANVSNTFPVGSHMYKFERPIKEICGRLNGDSNVTSFECLLAETEHSAGPSEVRKFLTGSEYGELVLRGTAATTYVWNSYLHEVELGFTPSIGTTVIAYSAGEHLFGDTFLSPDVIEENEKDVYLYLSSVYDCVFVGLSEIIASEVDASWYKISKEVATGTWEEYSNHTFCGHSAGEVIAFKVVNHLIDPTADIRNYYNISLYLGHLEMPTN